MTLSGRDRKLLIVIVVLAVLAGYWFLLLKPKRQEAVKLGDQLSKHESRRDAIRSKVDRLSAAQAEYAADYTTVVRMGKAIPPELDMPSLLVQLERAASGTRIKFDRISTGDRLASEGSGSSSGGGAAGSTSSSGSGQSRQTSQQAGQGSASSGSESKGSGGDAEDGEKGARPRARLGWTQSRSSSRCEAVSSRWRTSSTSSSGSCEWPAAASRSRAGS